MPCSLYRLHTTTALSQTAHQSQMPKVYSQGCPSGDLGQPLLQVLDVGSVGIPSSTLGATLQELHLEGQLGEFKFFAFLSQLNRCSTGTVQCAGSSRAGDS